MEKFIIFILATTGLVWILNKSKLLKPLREQVTTIRQLHPNLVMWFFDSVLSCSGCMGFWASIPVFVFIHPYFTWAIVLYCFIGSICSVMLISLWDLIERSK